MQLILTVHFLSVSYSVLFPITPIASVVKCPSFLGQTGKFRAMPVERVWVCRTELSRGEDTRLNQYLHKKRICWPLSVQIMTFRFFSPGKFSGKSYTGVNIKFSLGRQWYLPNNLLVSQLERIFLNHPSFKTLLIEHYSCCQLSGRKIASPYMQSCDIFESQQLVQLSNTIQVEVRKNGPEQE